MKSDTTMTTENVVGVAQPILVRLSLCAMWEIARAEGFDRAFGHGRIYVGPTQSRTLTNLGITEPATLLPLHGERWPKSVRSKMERIATETARSLYA